jgi:nucleoside-diphosphate-sugar epimerase
MNIAITGGTGFVGSHLAKSLTENGHSVVLIARGLDKRNDSVLHAERTQYKAISTSDEEKLSDAFEGCDAVAHCAGINRELNHGDYDRVHIQGTHNVINAAKRAGVKKVVMMSFCRARPNCGSRYHESKYEAEEIVRNSGLDYTVIKAGMIYGKGDHMLDHLSHVFHTMPLFALVGFRQRLLAPLAIEDVVRIMEAALVEGRLPGQTIPILGPEKMTMEELAKRVGKVVGRVPVIFPMPVFFHYGLAKILETIMEIPLVSFAQVRMLTEGFEEPSGSCQSLPDDLQAMIRFTDEQIRKGLPEPGPLSLHDLRFRSART